MDLNKHFGLLLTLSIACQCFGVNNGQSKVEFKTENCDDKGCGFSQLAIKKEPNGYLYIGARNRLFQVNSDLTLFKSVNTGPTSDNIDSINKILLIDNVNDRIIVCNSINHGLCELRKDINIGKVLTQMNVNATAVKQYVAAGADLSTVAFLANTRSEQFLFVGSSKTSQDDQNVVFTVSQRRLYKDSLNSNMFSVQLFQDGIYVGDMGLIMKKEAVSQNFQVNFIDGFEFDQTGYFVITHPSQNSNQIHSYISQICMNENPSGLLRSYLELQVTCTANSRTYTKAIASVTRVVGVNLASSLGIPSSKSVAVMFISFEDPDAQGHSAICMYPLYEIDYRYVSLVGSCMNGKVPQGKISWLQREEVQCGYGRFTVTSPVCNNLGVWDVAQFLQGSEFSKQAVFVSDNLVTALEVTTSHDHTIAFLGTSQGTITKLKLNSNRRYDEANLAYETIVVDDSGYSRRPINSIQLAYNNPSSTHTPMIYAMSPNVLVGLPVHNCSKFKDCSSCLGSGDPFCGWCPLETSCTSMEKCTRPGFIEKQKNCPRLESADLSLSINKSQSEITLTAYNIPHVQPSSEYRCKFDDQSSAHTTIVYNRDMTSTVRCITPSKAKIPPLNNAGSRQVDLSLTFQDKPVVSTNFTYYSCKFHSSCMACVNSGFHCVWCTYESTCVESKSDCNFVNDMAKDSSSCPQISSFRVSGQAESAFYLANGRKSNLVLNGAKLVSNQPDNYKCHINIPNVKQWVVNADRNSPSRVTCRGVEGFVPSGRRSANATVTVQWKNQIKIDSAQPLTVVMYSCALEDGSSNCGTCLQSPEQWQCGWCQSDDTCTHSNEPCTNWIKAQADQVCSFPHIDSFSPTTANPGGTTSITLTGTNFDSGGNMNIRIAGHSCSLQHSNCCSASCNVHASDIGSGNISLCITDKSGSCRSASKYHTSTSELFHFVRSTVDILTPSKVLCGWGTPLTITGSNLDAGNNVTVRIDGQVCTVSLRTSTKLECRLPCGVTCDGVRRRRRHLRRHTHKRMYHRLFRPKRAATPNAWLDFDGVQKVPSTNSEVTFHRTVTIRNIQPTTSFFSGGIPLLVTGTNLRLVHNPHIKVVWEDESNVSKCRVIGQSNTLECVSPSIKNRRTHASKTGGMANAVYIESPGCEETQWKSGQLQYVPDPVFEMFDSPDQTKIYRNEPIYIFGSNLCPVGNDCMSEIVSVMIGDEECNVTRYDTDQIECQPPAVDIGKYPVVVTIGGYGTQVGSLEYTQEDKENLVLVAAIAIPLLIVIGCLVLFVVCIYRRRMHASDQEVKNMQVQMSVMESKVAKVCKEAFAELQTDMSELDTVGGGVGIPYLHYRAYLMRVLFPDPSMAGHHSLLIPNHLERSDSRTSSTRPMQRAQQSLTMDHFNSLLENKCFMLCFIRSIERQNTFTMKDKANVAGLILVILQNRLVYATEILEQLLSELIDKNMESKNHPKLLLRRTESVAEKMLTHWFSILLHRFVVECAGEPLFMLYRAIKQQVDKGPVDMFTNEARYSLSEDKLLRQTVEHEVITLRVTNYMSDHDQFEFAVKVLSCDSVSQVKRKVLDVAYMHVHYSMRPQPEHVDLEWRRPGPLGPFILRDEDTTNETDEDGKLVNTLKHYSVEDGSQVAVIPRQGSSVLNYSAMSTNSKASGHRHNGSGSRLFNSMEGSNTSLPRYKQTSRSGTPTLLSEGKLYHLVKQNDQDQREGNDRGNKMVSEIYLTRLLTTKGTIQKFVDDLFETIFSVTQRGHALPLAVKHMFDFLDHQADIHDITDPEIVHTWKSNCLPLRFWVNMIKNPEFVFDIHKSAIVDCYLSVIAQAFMDSCSTAEYKYGKDSPSNKLLYAKDIPNYRRWVKSYYSDITEMPRLNPKNMAAFLKEESYAHSGDFNTVAALQQLYGYVQRYYDQILESLMNEPEAIRQKLPERLEGICLPSNGAS
uniref:Plexin-A2-like n=1 Tax=Phallusia mammillata TaxID=59560 RepID=A0A6F9DP97_9ASCI|nr:plexin-A2-like [Phallusia mammillata]